MIRIGFGRIERGDKTNAHTAVIRFTESVILASGGAQRLMHRRGYPGEDLVAFDHVQQLHAGQSRQPVREAAGGIVLEGVCFYNMHAREIGDANGWRRLMSNSAKIVNILGGYGYRPALASMQDCIEAAIEGKMT